MLSLRCLISALTQAGGGDLLLRFASSIQSCCGEGGALQADVAVCGEHSQCSGRAASSFGGLSPGAARLFPPWRAAPAARGLRAFLLVRHAFSVRGKRLGWPEVCARSPRVRRAFSLHGERPGQPGVWHPLHGRAVPFPSAALARAAGRVSGSLQTGTGACLPGGRGWLLWG